MRLDARPPQLPLLSPFLAMKLLQRRDHHLRFSLLPALQTSSLLLFLLHELIVVPVPEDAVLVPQLVDDRLGHGRAQERGDPGPLVDFDPQRVFVVVFFFWRGYLGEGDGVARFEAGDVALEDLAAPSAAVFFVDHLRFELVDDHVASDSGGGVEERVDEADVGELDGGFGALNGADLFGGVEDVFRGCHVDLGVVQSISILCREMMALFPIECSRFGS